MRAAEYIGAGFFVAAEFEQAARLRFFEQVAEGAEAVIGFREIGTAALERVFQQRGPDFAGVAALGRERIERLDHHVERLHLARFEFFLALVVADIRVGVVAGVRAARLRRGLALVALGGGAALFAHQVIIEDEFVAVRHQQVGGRLLDAHADHLLVIFTQLRDQRREVGVAADDDEGVDVRLRVAQIECIDDEADVGRILARLAHVRDLDQLEVRFMHRRLEALVAVPVAVRLLDHDAALEQQAFQHWLDVEFFVIGVANAQCDVFKVAEHRHADVVGRRGHELFFL